MATVDIALKELADLIELGGEKGVKYFLDIPVRDAATPIRDFQAGISLILRLPVNGKRLGGGDIGRGSQLDAQVYCALALAIRLPGIGCQIRQHLLYLVGIGDNGRAGARQITLNPYCFRQRGPQRGQPLVTERG